jgi:hypothetical protein
VGGGRTNGLKKILLYLSKNANGLMYWRVSFSWKSYEL